MIGFLEAYEAKEPMDRFKSRHVRLFVKKQSNNCAVVGFVLTFSAGSTVVCELAEFNGNR